MTNSKLDLRKPSNLLTKTQKEFKFSESKLTKSAEQAKSTPLGPNTPVSEKNAPAHPCIGATINPGTSSSTQTGEGGQARDDHAEATLLTGAKPSTRIQLRLSKEMVRDIKVQVPWDQTPNQYFEKLLIDGVTTLRDEAKPGELVDEVNVPTPVDETPVATIRVGTATTAPATTIAYIHDIFLELVAPNWQTTIWKAERPVKNDWFKGRNPNARKVTGEIASHIEIEQIAKNNRTIGGHIEAAEGLINRCWDQPKEYSRDQIRMIYRTIYGYSQAVISAWEVRTGKTISYGISNPGLTVAKLFQRIDQLPPGLTEEQLAECLDASWGLYSLKHSGNWTL